MARENPEDKFKLMIAGMPNVGKSTLLNRMRAVGTSIGGKAVRTGGLPGITRAVSEYVRISPYPRLYMLDTPGVLMPKIVDPEVGLKIALTGGMIDRVVGEYLLAEYLLHTLNQSPRMVSAYKKAFALAHPTQDAEQILSAVAQCMGQVGPRNTSNAVARFLKLFRTGGFGRVTLDKVPLPA